MSSEVNLKNRTHKTLHSWKFLHLCNKKEVLRIHFLCTCLLEVKVCTCYAFIYLHLYSVQLHIIDNSEL